MNGDENPYSSPRPLDENQDPNSPAPPTQVLLAAFLGLQAGGMLGLCSGLLAPFRFILRLVPLETAMLEVRSSEAHVQIIGESIFIAISCLLFGAIFGAVLEIGEKLIQTRTKASNWFLFSSLKIHRISNRGLLFAIVGAAPPLLILTASHSRSDPFIWLHGVWALAHLLLAIYFGERFAETCQRIEAESKITDRSAPA
jgi:hypothetical protein